MKTHFEMVDAVNDAQTQAEHDFAVAALAGWRSGRRWSGIDADFHTMQRFGEDRPMCCGELLDWVPNVLGKGLANTDSKKGEEG